MQSVLTLLDGIQQLLREHIFELFRDPNVAIGLSVVLLAVGVVFTLWLIFGKWLPFSRRIKRLSAEVKTTEDAHAFVTNFTRIDQALSRIKIVRHGWEEFKETLVFPSEGSHDPIRNTSRPSSYINLSVAETSGLHIRFFQAVPNYFVGIGLLFTFLGLVAAIYFASEGISETADINETQRRLQDLLHAATFKFLTSIAGISASLLVAITYRLVAGNLQKHFDKLCEALEERLIFATSESIAFSQYQELQKQSLQLERFNTDLAFSIAQELDNRLNSSLQSSLEKALAPLSETMSDMADRFGEMNQDAMSSMLNSFTDNLQQGAGSEMQALAETLSETKESLGSLVSAMQSAGGQLNDTFTESMATQLEKMSVLNGELDTLVQHIAAASDRLRDAGAPVASASEAIESAASAIGESSNLIGNTHKELSSLAETMNKAAEETKALWSDYQKRFEQVDKDLANTFRELSDGTAQQHSTIKEFVSGMDQELDKALRNLGAGIEGLQETLEELSGILEKFGEPVSGSRR